MANTFARKRNSCCTYYDKHVNLRKNWSENEKIVRNLYFERFIAKRKNGPVKVVTGVRRCGRRAWI